MDSFAQVLARLRSARDLSYARLAGAVPCSDTYLWQLETQGRQPQRATAAAIDRALGADGELLAALPPEPVMPTAPLTAADLPELRDTVAHLVGLDTLHGSGGIHRRAEGLYLAYRGRLGFCLDPDVRAAVAEVGQVAAWLAPDADRGRKGRHLLESVLPLAAGAPVERLVLDQLANVAYDEGAPADALLFAERGLALSPAGVTRGMFELRAARARGLLGDAAGALAAMDRAGDLIGAGPRSGETPQPWWTTWPDYLVHRGGLLLDLGRVGEAVGVRAAALNQAGGLPLRERGLAAGYLALAHAAAGDRRVALEVVGRATAVGVRARRLFSRVRRLCR